jgi:5-methylcytosine-specific restriction endonuclease McrA
MTTRRDLPRKPSGTVHCHYCADPLNRNNTWDHLVPHSRGGLNLPANLVVACRRCNREKAHMSLERYRALVIYRKSLRALGSYRFIRVTGYRFWGERRVNMR